MIVLAPDPLKIHPAQGLPEQQCSKELSFVTQCVAGVQLAIEPMPQLLSEHGNNLLLIGCLQPTGIEVDGAGVGRIGASNPGHLPSLKELNTW